MLSPYIINALLKRRTIFVVWLTLLSVLLLFVMPVSVSSDSGAAKHNYDEWETPDDCGSSCHVDIYQQWKQSMMSQSYTHHWDEIEYFKLAVPHAEKDDMVAEVKAGCNGCHAPMSFLVGDVPPPRPEENSRANEGVHCDFCHTITGFDGDLPFNFNYVVDTMTKFQLTIDQCLFVVD